MDWSCSWLETWHGGDCWLSGWYFHFLPISQAEPQPEQQVSSLTLSVIMIMIMEPTTSWLQNFFNSHTMHILPSWGSLSLGWTGSCVKTKSCCLLTGWGDHDIILSSMRKSQELRTALYVDDWRVLPTIYQETRGKCVGTAAQSLVVKLRSADPRVA